MKANLSHECAPVTIEINLADKAFFNVLPLLQKRLEQCRIS
jgi:hypothetical protein